MRTLVAIATYNEIDNLPTLIDQVFQHAPGVDILVIDDNSPDGTGRWVAELAGQNEHVHCLHRPGKLGLGTAAIAGFQFAVQRNYDLVLTMDADHSHPPRFIPPLIRIVEESAGEIDVAIGSRYVAGGKIEGWPVYRRVMSRAMNTYARLLLGLTVKDTSGAFRCYRTECLRDVDFGAFLSRGYSYLEEILWRLKRSKARFQEHPIVFVDRQFGRTKINTAEALSALWMILRLAFRDAFRA